MNHWLLFSLLPGVLAGAASSAATLYLHYRWRIWRSRPRPGRRHADR